MTQHAHHAARYSAVVALAGALLAPGVTTPATALEDPGPKLRMLPPPKPVITCRHRILL